MRTIIFWASILGSPYSGKLPHAWEGGLGSEVIAGWMQRAEKRETGLESWDLHFPGLVLPMLKTGNCITVSIPCAVSLT